MFISVSSVKELRLLILDIGLFERSIWLSLGQVTTGIEVTLLAAKSRR